MDLSRPRAGARGAGVRVYVDGERGVGFDGAGVPFVSSRAQGARRRPWRQFASASRCRSGSPGRATCSARLLLHVDYWILILTAGFFAARMAQRLAQPPPPRRQVRDGARARPRREVHSVETGMLEWINHVLRHEWRAVIGVQVDAQAKGPCRASCPTPTPCPAASCAPPPSRSSPSASSSRPPHVRLQVQPRRGYLQFEFDMTWNTVSSHILVRATVQPTEPPPVTVPFTSPTSPSPAASSSASSPQRIPASPAWTSRSRTNPRCPCPSDRWASRERSAGRARVVRSRIAAVFAASYVEPRRYYQDVERMYSRRRGASAGPSGRSSSTSRAPRLPATNKDSRTSNPYLEVTYAGVTRYTATH